MVDDVYDIIAAVAATAEGRNAIREKHTVSALCQAVANRCYRMFIVCLHVCVHTVNCLMSLPLENLLGFED